MTVNDYIQQRFQSFGINLSEADLLEITIDSNTAGEDDVTSNNITAVSIGIARFIPSLLLRATAINESGFSISWDINGIKEYYWKSHATLTLLANQDCPFWLQYD